MSYLMTQSLLSSWLYIYKAYEDHSEQAYQSFLDVLNKMPTETTEAMQNGVNFENLVSDIITGKEVRREFLSWKDAAGEVAKEIKGGQLQMPAKAHININNIDLLLYGRLDALKAGTIYDIKFTKNYDAGKFYDSIQHAMYFEIVPEARRFVYIVSNGDKVWKETYLRSEVRPIKDTISDFITFISDRGLLNVYFNKWEALGK